MGKLSKADIDFDGPVTRFGEEVLRFADPDGLQLELVASVDHPGDAIQSFHSATISEEGYERTAQLLTQTPGFPSGGQEGNRFRFVAGTGSVKNRRRALQSRYGSRSWSRRARCITLRGGRRMPSSSYGGEAFSLV